MLPSRILYMRHETWVKYVVGEMRLSRAFLLINLMESAYLTYHYVDGPKELVNQCDQIWRNFVTLAKYLKNLCQTRKFI